MKPRTRLYIVGQADRMNRQRADKGQTKRKEGTP